MLDIRWIREEPERVREALRSRGADPAAVDQILELDQRRRALISESDTLKQRRNEESKRIGARIKAGENAEALKAEIRDLGDQIQRFDEELREVEARQREILLLTPNLPHASTPRGPDASGNVIVRTVGEPREFDFAPLCHWDLGARLGILDLERAANISGSGFYFLTGAGARLERALIQWFLDTHVTEHGYLEVAPPFLVRREAMTGTGQLPKFIEDMYCTDKGDDLFLIPTAEVPVTNYHAGEILGPTDVPRRFCAYTPCFRREAGAHGKETRGITRVHQFSKVELVHYTTPETSYEAHELLTSHAEILLRRLGLAYRVVSLCSGDLGFGAAKCYDLEVWAPGMKQWLEVSSCSNFESFQARRANIRFRRAPDSRPEFVHTLNGSALALPRCIIALLETWQQSDGSILLPEPLRDRMGADRIPAR